jgi:2-oxoglutarate dehydrogenase E1 component
MTREEAAEIGERFDADLRRALETSRSAQRPEVALHEAIDMSDDDPGDWAGAPSPETGVPLERLIAIVDESNRIPDGFVTHPNLLRQLRRRESMVRGEQDVDWGCAEALAYGSLLEEGVPVRLAGQDSGRGTFSHRHAVIRDQLTEAEYVPLKKLERDGARFEAWDSLLSEEAALAYEYGYAVARPKALALWEAQFGDFVNGAQIPVDQFLVSGESKWRQLAGVVLLLPHGYDGQGPEHSSGRPERFLAACSDGNLTVCNCTTSAQLFHLLRRQGRAEPKRPLVVLTPKSLLRDKRAAAPIAALGPGEGFRELLADPAADPELVRRVVLSSGKVHYDLRAARDERSRRDVALLRLEQIYPFPLEALRAEIARFPGAQLVWCQEEPRNMGAWPFLEERLAGLGIELAYAGRPRASSPATGSHARHVAEQRYVVERALGEG